MVGVSIFSENSPSLFSVSESTSLSSKLEALHSGRNRPNQIQSAVISPILKQGRPKWLRQFGTYEYTWRTSVPNYTKDQLQKTKLSVSSNSKIHLELEIIDSTTQEFYNGKKQSLLTINYLFTDKQSGNRVFEFADSIKIQNFKPTESH